MLKARVGVGKGANLMNTRAATVDGALDVQARDHAAGKKPWQTPKVITSELSETEHSAGGNPYDSSVSFSAS